MQQEEQRPLTRWLSTAPGPVLVGYAVFAAFATYFCMYAFRKPFAAAEFKDQELFGLGLKSAFVISQLLGYTLSKYIGTKICSEVTRGRRMLLLLSMIFLAEAALLLFAVVPPEFQVLAIFLNGLPLGMVWGLVVWYLEGRRTSELLLAGLSCSFIIASAIVKDIGRALMSGGDHLTIFAIDLPNPVGLLSMKVPNPFSSLGEIPEAWMPVATGSLFLIPFVVAVLLLNQLPRPSQADETARMHREPMNGAQRWAFLKRFFPGLAMLFLSYFFLTAFRDYRDNFGAEVFRELGYGDEPGIFSRSEIWVMFGVVIPLALLFLIKNNRWGLIGAFSVMLAGTVILGGSTILLDAQLIDGLTWMILIGLGSYLAYVPFGSVLFDRLLATTHVVGTAVFAIYMADALGYTGSVGVRLYKDFFQADISDFQFLRYFTYFMAVLGAVMFLGSCTYFLRQARRKAD